MRPRWFAALAVASLVAGSPEGVVASAPGAAVSEGLPPLACIQALRSARLADAAGKVEEAERGYESALDGCGRHVVALLELFSFLERRGLDPTTRAAVVAELERRLDDPDLVVPDTILEQLAANTATAPELLAAVDRRCRSLIDAGADAARQQALWRARGRIAERRADLETAMMAARRLFELGEYNFEAALAWHSLASELRRWDEALQAWRALAQVDAEPTSAEYQWDWYEIELAGRAGLLDQQRAALRAKFAAPPKPTDQVWELTTGLAAVFALRDAGQHQEAAELVRLVTARHPERREPRRVLVHLYADQAEGQAILDQAVQGWMASDDPQEVAYGIVDLIEVSRLAEAETVMGRLAEIGGDHPDLWERVRNAAINARAMAVALEAARRCAELCFNQREAQSALGNVLLTLERCEEALVPLGRALELGETQVMGAIDFCRAQLQRSRR